MFASAKNFNQPIGNWDVSNVKFMAGMFCNATTFNQPIDNWDVSNVQDMSWMFHGAKSFNQPLNSWDIEDYEEVGLPDDYEKKLKTKEPVKAKKSIHR